jgi:hypothetical protein
VDGGGGGAERKRPHPSTCGGWMGGSLVADDDRDGLKPNGEARVHPRLPKIMRIDFEKKKIISKDFKMNV